MFTTEAAERVARALSALRLDIWIVVLSAAFVVSEAAPGRLAKSEPHPGDIGDTPRSQLVSHRSMLAIPCTHGSIELFTTHGEPHGFAPWAEYKAEGGTR